ncbi:NfeD-like C-terminal, partner-binding [Micromonospora pallida]|uniref:NfeD-like C-terminal, partner-binding n=1 Tax=Micromonospora pallida TaxID=145854 RepID=A0A1C6TB96_9ACTN|nr:NfeD family protein [Micromonospora pallida]SCL38783.1 NfeD-like C-terminal, partner-binding [Micromonospora pallida]
MATGTLVFLIIGAVSVAVLAIALLGGELLHVVHPDVDGPVSLEVIAAFAGALGFGGAIANELIGGGSPAMIAGAAGVGALAAVPAAWFAGRLSRAARTMRTDPTPTRDHMVGALGLVVTPIPATGYGEVRVRLAGQPVKLNARADRPIPAGTQVFVVESLSETSVHVETY